MDDDETAVFQSDNNLLDLSFTSCTSTSTATEPTFTSSSARSSLTLSFTDSRRVSAPVRHPHRRHDPHWASISAATALSSDGTLRLRHLKLLHHLGTGNLGRVFLCRLRNCHPSAAAAEFALKVVDRDAATREKLEHVDTEAQVLAGFDHPFLPTLYARLEESHYTCLLIDYCPNGDLNALLRRQPRGRLTVTAARFYAAEVLVALEYLHAAGIVYRDLKPENVLIRADGHVMLSDFDLCFRAEVVPAVENGSGEFVAEPTAAYSRSCVGTHEYLAPEVVSGGGHGSGVDWWAFGVFLYELLHGTTPFKGESKEGTLRNIIAAAACSRSRWRGVMRPFDAAEEMGEAAGLMAEARDLIARLLVKDPAMRLGCARGAPELKRHPFFSGVEWALIRNYRPPEVRGLSACQAESHVRHVRASSSHHMRGRRRWWWWWRRRLACFVNNNNNNNNNNNRH